MQILEIVLIAISLSFDTFAVSVSTGVTINNITFWQGVRAAVVLAFFQAFMPLPGWFGGMQLEKYVADIDHWIAFGLLFLLGSKMILDTFKEEENKKVNPLLFPVLVWLGIATSIDALVVGIGLGLIQINIVLAIIIIGFTTFLAAMIGMLLGKNAKGKLGQKAEMLGGLVLIGIGVKILIEHLA